MLSLIAVSSTVSAVPWFLGGAIPHARSVLQIGAVVGAVFAMLSAVLRRRGLSRLPATSLPLLGFSCLGLAQLVPLYEHPVLQMRHAVASHLVSELPITPTAGQDSGHHVRSLMPSETRLHVGQYVSLALIVLTLFEVVQTRREVVLSLSLLVLSACLMTGLALSQQFAAVDATIGNHWKVSRTKPFGCFVNPNNAAGWLMICGSGAMLLCSLSFEQRWRYPSAAGITRLRKKSSSFSELWRSLLGRLADLTSSQILTASAMILLMAGIAATLSRAGILAAVLGLAAFVMSRSRSGRFFWTLLSLSLIILLCGSFLALLDLDTFIISELQTLKDPVSDSTGRILHWSDSLKSGLDFPLLGSGLGAYRYASLPYQKHFTGKWFQRADNQYVEVLVEGGLAGFACFVLTGLIALKYVRCGLSERSRLSPHSDEIVTGLSSAVLCAVVSIAGAAFFDYGISLPSVAAALVTLVVLLERQVKLKQSRSSRGDFAPSLNPGSPSLLSSVSALAVWVALIASSVMMIPDTLAAARLYTVSASVERQIQSSNVESLMEIGDQSLHDLDRALAERPDDVVARRTRCLFLELLVRREILKAQIDGKSRTPGQLGNEFRSIQISNLADGMLDAKMSDEVRSTIRIQLDAIFQSYPWPESLRELLDQAPCVLTIASKLSQCELLFGDVRSATSAMSHSRFTEPHGADSLYILGHLMLRAGRVEECRQCWSQSIAASESYRSTIMIELADQHGLDMALEWFLPETYEAAVKSAAAMPKLLPLRIQILRHADQLWDDQRPRLTETAILTRAQHLSMTAGEADAVLWLDGALQQAPQNLRIRKAKARLLEEAGQNSEAYDEWLRIQSFDLADPEPGVALERLIRLPPTTERD